MISPDPCRAQEPRSLSTGGKTKRGSFFTVGASLLTVRLGAQTRFPTASKKASIVCRKCPKHKQLYAKKLKCKQESSNCEQKMASFQNILFTIYSAPTSLRHTLSGPVLRDTARLSQRCPPIARYGALVPQHGQLGAIPPPPFQSVSPLESMRNGEVRYPPTKGVSQRYLRDTL